MTIAEDSASVTGNVLTNDSDAGSKTVTALSLGASSGALSGSATRAIAITPMQDAPVLAAGGAAQAYTEQGMAAVIDATVVVSSDADDTQPAGATVTISNGYAPSDGKGSCARRWSLPERGAGRSDRHTIIDKRPEQLKMDFFLWSRAAVGRLIEQEYDIKLQVRSVGKYLARRGFIPQKPIKRAYEQSPAAVQVWLEGEYPGISERARHEGAEIHWGDETALINTDVRGRSFAPAGQTPVAMTLRLDSGRTETASDPVKGESREIDGTEIRSSLALFAAAIALAAHDRNSACVSPL